MPAQYQVQHGPTTKAHLVVREEKCCEGGGGGVRRTVYADGACRRIAERQVIYYLLLTAAALLRREGRATTALVRPERSVSAGWMLLDRQMIGPAGRLPVLGWVGGLASAAL